MKQIFILRNTATGEVREVPSSVSKQTAKELRDNLRTSTRLNWVVSRGADHWRGKSY